MLTTAAVLVMVCPHEMAVLQVLVGEVVAALAQCYIVSKVAKNTRNLRFFVFFPEKLGSCFFGCVFAHMRPGVRPLRPCTKTAGSPPAPALPDNPRNRGDPGSEMRLDPLGGFAGAASRTFRGL
jgi:hypothetical protein